MRVGEGILPSIQSAFPINEESLITEIYTKEIYLKTFNSHNDTNAYALLLVTTSNIYVNYNYLCPPSSKMTHT